MAGKLPNVIRLGTGIAGLGNAAGSAVPILYLQRDSGGLGNHAPPLSEFLVLKDLSCCAVYNDWALARQNRETHKLRVHKLVHFQRENERGASLVRFMGEHP